MENGVKKTQVELLGDFLRDPKKPIKARFRALFTLKSLKTEESVDELKKALQDTTNLSTLLRHEVAYCLGQMKMPSAVNLLYQILSNIGDSSIVRHECGEALAAIGTFLCKEALDEFKDDPTPEVAETCQIGLERIGHLLRATEPDSLPSKHFESVDPAFPLQGDGISESNLGEILLDKNRSLYERYQAMFSLRDIKDSATISKGFKDNSALFRHEVAFVLGQLADPDTIPALEAMLKNEDEHAMVRHECAEALGAIGTPEAVNVLEKYTKDEEQIVRESVIVALDICEYNLNPNEFQYADGLNNIIYAESEVAAS